MKSVSSVAASVFSLIVFSASLASADTIQLVNGDTISGKVVSLSDKELKLNSEALGEITITRDKVATISFGDRPVAATPAAPAVPSTPAAEYPLPKALPPAKTPQGLIRQLGQAPGLKKQLPIDGGAQGEEDVLKQLQEGTLDPNAIRDLQKDFPLLATPKAQEYFNDTLSGLITGRKGLQDIRKDAVKARDLILELKEEMGAPAEALNMYLDVLENFIDETEPPAEEQPAPKADTPDRGAPAQPNAKP